MRARRLIGRGGLTTGAVLVAAVLIGGCATDPEVEFPGPPEPVTEIDVTDLTVSADSSALDATRTSLDPNERALLDLIVDASGDGNLFLLAILVDDPNGTGRIDGRWYPPRIRSGNCSIEVDAAPIPTVSASFIPSEAAPDDPDDQFQLARVQLETPFTVSVQLQLFDDASQRAEFAAVMQDFYDQMGGFGCEESGGEAADAAAGMLGGDREELEAYETGYPGTAQQLDVFFNSTYANEYLIGDRVLLTVAITNNGIVTGDDELADPSIAHLVIDAQVERLTSFGLG